MMHCLGHVLTSRDGQPVTVLVVEDEDLSRKALVTLLNLKGFVARSVVSAEEALALIGRGQTPTFALIDLDLPGMSGHELVEHLRQSNPSIHAILVTAADSERIGVLMRGRPVDHLRKPIDFNTLLRLLRGDAARPH